MNGKIVFLIVDDDSQMRRLVKRVLSSRFPDASFDEAENGLEAVQSVAITKPTLIVLDFNMPELNGIRACGRIRKTPSLKDVKILIVSAEVADDLEEKSLEAGANAFLAKPFTPEQLLKKVSDLLNPPAK